MGKKREMTACIIKRVHYNMLSALHQCISLHRSNPYTHISMYECNFCDGVHITSGHFLKSCEQVDKVLARNLKIMRDIHWWEHAPKEVIDSRIALEIEAVQRLLGMKPLRTDRITRKIIYYTGDTIDDTPLSRRNNPQFLSNFSSFLSIKLLPLLKLFSRTLIPSRKDANQRAETLCIESANSSSSEESW